MGKRLILIAMFFITSLCYSQTREEMAASEYALAFARQLGIAETENNTVKAEVLRLKTTNALLILNYYKMEDLVEYWKVKYNVSDKEAKREIRKAKRKAWFRGVGVGVGTGIVVVLAVATLTK